MDFSPTEAQQDLAGLTRRILTGTPGTDRFDRARWQALATAGVLAAALPESVGGSGFGVLEQCSVLLELGRETARVPYLDSIMLAASALTRFAPAALRERWAAPAATGEVILTAALEDEGAHAEPVPGGWRLTGGKTAVPFAAEADAILVPVTGDTVFLVTPTDPGVLIEPQDTVDETSAGRLTFESVLLGEDRIVGPAADWLTTTAAIGLSATQLGVAERALELTAEHARTRIQFDRPIGTFQAVGQRLADAYIDVEAIRLSLWQAAWRRAADLDCAAEVATAKFWAAEAGHRVAHTAVHVHGGMGIDTSHALHRYFTAAKRNEFQQGGATTHLRDLGDLLAREPVPLPEQ
ncbi:MAG TPA: acyl-CoA dehydrogenase family protein [Pseudonocardiaceae bacterium]|jgi:acyl-CoA dehydrogenase|nr:acyl-CoA dehydrogenase family protein [Pseudonocardiaceae bacterium]